MTFLRGGVHPAPHVEGQIAVKEAGQRRLPRHRRHSVLAVVRLVFFRCSGAAWLAETQGVRPVRIRWLSTPERTSPARDVANVWAQVQAICREAMVTGRTIAMIETGVSNRILEVRPSAIVRASDGAWTPDGQGAPVTRPMAELACLGG